MSRQRRKSGYIRTNHYQLPKSPPHRNHFKHNDYDSSLSFSPFKYSISPSSPFRHPSLTKHLPKERQLSRKVSQKISQKSITNPHKKCPIQPKYNIHDHMNESQQQQIKEIQNPYKRKAIPLSQQIKRSQITKNKQLQVKKITLAQAFSLNCTKLKQKLQNQRQIFKKKQKQKNNKSQIQFDNPDKKTEIRKINTQQKQNRSINMNRQLPNQRKIFNNINHQNNNTIKPQKNSINQSTSKCTSFWVPGCSTARNKSNFTPRQMYCDTLAKWKQLPQVKQKQKKQKQKIEMRMRKQKAKLHNIQLRKRVISKF